MYKEQFQKDLNDYLTLNNYEGKAPVSYSDFEDYQYQSSIAFSLKKKYPDFNIEDFLNYLKSKPYYQEVSITGNNFISVKFQLKEYAQEHKEAKTVVVDYCGVNVAKQMHIGHIRSMFIGDFAVRAHAKDNVIIQNHIGDWGNQFGFLLNYIKTYQLEDTLDNKKLTEYYKKAYELNNTDEVFASQSAQVAYTLQNNLDSSLHALWQKLVTISMVEAEKTFEEFGLKMNMTHTQGESFYAPMCDSIITDLLEKGIATEENGATLVFLNKKSPLLLKKSNGNFLYALYDLAAIKWRVENFNPDKIVYVVDKRQALHFEQVFEVAKKAGYAKEVELIHLGFGTVLGEDKKPLKTKSGASLYLDDLLKDGKDILSQDSHYVSMNENYKDNILNKTIIGGLKFYDLKFTKTQDYIFDWKHVLNFTGGSAPYIQNAFVRIDSIFFKKWGADYQTQPLDWNINWSASEQELLFQCQKVTEITEDLVNTYASQQLTTQLIKVCQLFHKYYEGEKVLGSTKEAQKLQLFSYIQETLSKGCDTLGIETYPCIQKLELITKTKILKLS